jgi:hypothetical protein
VVAVSGIALRRAISGRFNYVRTERQTMEFDPAFTLLKKFTVGIESSVSGSDTINNQDIAAVAEYLGVELPAISISECIRIIETELLAQNKFLTMNLRNINIEQSELYEIEQSELYEKSRFVREVILNNRSRLKT